MDIAEMLIKFKGDDSDVNKTIKSLGSSLSGLATGAFATFTAAVVGASGALAKMLQTSVEAAGELEQLSGGAQKIFDEMDYKQIEQDAVNAYNSMNMSAREYLGVINVVGANFATTLGDKEGYETAKEGLQAISDFASGTGLSVDKLSTSFQTISKSTQSYQRTASQFAGILPTTSQAFLEQAQELGYLSDEYGKLNDVPVAEYQKALIKMMNRGTKAIGLQGNTMAESSETLTGSIASLTSVWDNFLSGVGDTDTVIDTAVIALEQIGKKIIEMLPVVTDGIVELLNGLIPMLPSLVQKLLPPLINGVMSLINGIIAMLPTFIKMLATMLPTIITSLISGFADAVNALAEQAPILIPMIIEAIMDAILALVDPENIDKLITSGIALMEGLIEGIMNSIPVLMEKAPEIISSLIEALITELPRIYTMGPRLILALAKGLIDAIPSLVLKVPRIIKAIVEGLKNGISNVKEIGGDMIKGLWNGMKGMKDWVIQKIKSLGKEILNGMKSVLGISSPSTEFAVLGKFSAEGYAEGLEDMQKDIDKAINATFNPFNNSTIGSMNASTPQSNITILNSMEFDPLGQLVNNVKSFSGGAKNDYNYVGGY